MKRDELTKLAMQSAMLLARKEFAGRNDCEELASDAMSRAWEFAQRAGNRATPLTIAGYAVKNVKVSRQFQHSIRSVDHPRNRLSHARLPLVSGDFARAGEDPALIAQINIDLTDWIEQLSSIQRKVATLYATGYRTGEIARLLKKSASRISQIREELRVNWAEFLEEC